MDFLIKYMNLTKVKIKASINPFRQILFVQRNPFERSISSKHNFQTIDTLVVWSLISPDEQAGLHSYLFVSQEFRYCIPIHIILDHISRDRNCQVFTKILHNSAGK